MKLRHLGWLIFAVLFIALSCKKDDDDDPIEIRDRTEQYAKEIDSIETFLETHFYNYEDFASNPNAEIEIDTIAGDNANKEPLTKFVSYKNLKDHEDVAYKLYYLTVRKGGGEQPTFADSTYVAYKGNTLYGELFDQKPFPVWMTLPSSIQGFREVISEFKGASGLTKNPDGSINFEDYGIGAVFIPSGLGYYEAYQSVNLPSYSPLIFRFEVFNAKETDSDQDGIPNFYEDLDGDRNLYSEDTDEDGYPNFLDTDDDGDGILTKNEDLNEDGNFNNDDTDGDGIPNYLDEDSTESILDD